MKITVYTITDCKFSQAEKQYLQSRQVQFEEKNLEANREYLTEMLNISNNFAGTPVTKIEKDDGQIIVLKGFTQEEFDKALVVDPNAVKVQNTQSTDTQAGTVSQQVAVTIPPQPPIQSPPPQPVQSPPPMAQPMMPTPPIAQAQPPFQPPMPPQPMSQPDMMPQTAPPQAMSMQLPEQPVQPQQVQQQQMPPTPPQMDISQPQAPVPPPADDQALNSLLQNLQNRVGDTTNS